MKNRKELGTKHNVPTDQTYIQNINLVTGAKFNYDRPLSTQREIKQLCIDQKLTKLQKFCYLIQDGQKIQKWSILQNLNHYISTLSDAQKIFYILIKNYPQLIDFLPIMGDGIHTYLQKNIKNINKKVIQHLYKIIHRTLTQYPLLIDDWIMAFQSLMKVGNCDDEDFKQYINNSFGMNSPPQRRRVALMMIQKMFEYSKDIRESCRSKILFFNHDQNAKVRQTICIIMQKMLIRDNDDEQIWKSIWQYYNDKDKNVKVKALQTLTRIFHKKNFAHIYQLLDVQQDTNIFVINLREFLLNYRSLIIQDHNSKTKLVSFCNRILRNKSQNVQKLFDIFQQALLPILGEVTITQQLNFFKNQSNIKENLPNLIKVYHIIKDTQFQDQIKIIILKGLKQSKYNLNKNVNQFIRILDLRQQQDMNHFYLLGQKLYQKSKWTLFQHWLQNFSQLRLFQTLYQKYCIFILKVWLTCPIFIGQKVIECVLFLMLSNKKSLQFLITIRDKMLNSKTWFHRRNYIFFYTACKKKCSFEFNKLIPTLQYKTILSQKYFGIKLSFLQLAPDIFQHLDPLLLNQKNIIKEMITKMGQDKDKYVREKAIETEQIIKKIEKDSSWVQKLYDRNRQLMQIQEEVEQVLSDQKQTVKAENDMKKTYARRKTINQNKKKGLNFMRDMTQKQISFDVLNQSNKGSDTKRVNLFRCHSVKIKVPTKKK